MANADTESARYCEVCRHWFAGPFCKNCGWAGTGYEPSHNGTSGTP